MSSLSVNCRGFHNVAHLLIVLDKWLLGSIAQEDDVRFSVAASDEELFSVPKNEKDNEGDV